MIGNLIDTSQRGKVWMMLAIFAVILFITWRLSTSIVAGSFNSVVMLGAAFIAFFVTARIAGDWRSGVSLFFGWLLFEDLIRKYMGNSMYVYFAKDALVGMIYFSMLLDRTRRDTAVFRPPFRYALTMFFVLGLVQVFNPLSPSGFYGVLGLKLYFYYVPLMFVGYALLRSEDDLRRFLVLSMGLAGVISVIGIVQATGRESFLNPRGGAEIDELGHLVRYTKSGLSLVRPPSVFVSDGRFAEYLILTFALGLGTAGFLLLRPGKGRKLVFPALGLVGLATVMSGGRAAFVYVAASAILLSIGMLWGSPPSVGAGYRLVKAIRRSFVLVAVLISLSVLIFPDFVGARWQFYHESFMSSSGESSDAEGRAWSYPVQELRKALADPNWIQGHGIGTASLGMQYVSRILGVASPDWGTESGYGNMILELGILGPLLWLLWTLNLMIAAGKTMLDLKGTWAFPIALSITWFSFQLLFLMTWGSLVPYENFVLNAYFWLLIGFLFRLPDLVKKQADDLQVALVSIT